MGWIVSEQKEPPKFVPVEIAWIINDRIEHKEVSEWHGGEWKDGWTPTHWRPLPDPPDSEG